MLIIPVLSALAMTQFWGRDASTTLLTKTLSWSGVTSSARPLMKQRKQAAQWWMVVVAW